MKVERVQYQDQVYYASLNNDQVWILKKEGLKQVKRNEIKILPLVAPSKIICVGLNYLAHAREFDFEIPDEPLLFFKPPSAMIGWGEYIVCPAQSENVHFEGELAFVIKKGCRNIEPEEAKDYILGYTCANDVTARDLQAKDGLYARAKGFDTFCPIGPYIETELDFPNNLSICTYVNQVKMQEGNSFDMIFNVFELVSFISKIMTLNVGDIVLTGTPPGVGQIHPGDEVSVEIAGIGTLVNKVVAKKSL